MESYDIKTGCLFCDQGDRSKGREKDHDLLCPGHSHLTILDKYHNRQWASRVQEFFHFSQNYILLMRFTTYDVQVMSELVIDSSDQWSLIKIQKYLDEISLLSPYQPTPLRTSSWKGWARTHPLATHQSSQTLAYLCDGMP